MGADLTAVGVFGGTFNPIHNGHLRSGLELIERLKLDQLRLMPSAIPPHRPTPACSAEHRAAMVELAVMGEERMVCDRRELQRPGRSYTIDSLEELRSEKGPDFSLCLVMGCDAVRDINSWHRWQKLLDYCHVIIIARPGWQLPLAGEVSAWLSDNLQLDGTVIQQSPHGGILVEELRPQVISSTEIRVMLAQGLSTKYLLPERVIDYIHNYNLYK
ncbi:MAG: nicotinate-nucleotide adenylyltransferase [Halieaceae bacterium]|nr:nicotinate-nucleotide adenylyltransferase [Halieaceae bacterium]